MTNPISDYLNAVHQDWQDSLGCFSKNVYLTHYRPIPFFGNPATALVATVGVNPSSGEFSPDRNWTEAKTNKNWKLRLKNYFDQKMPPHEWFCPWRIGLKLLGISYEAGTAAHFDVSYRPTSAMLKTRRQIPRNFAGWSSETWPGFSVCCRFVPICDCCWSSGQSFTRTAQLKVWRDS
jgi:hypothetical protein